MMVGRRGKTKARPAWWRPAARTGHTQTGMDPWHFLEKTFIVGFRETQYCMFKGLGRLSRASAWLEAVACCVTARTMSTRNIDVHLRRGIMHDLETKYKEIPMFPYPSACLYSGFCP